MSEQLSLPAGGGLLSLNITALPQGASPLGVGGSQMLAGFNAILSQQAAEANTQQGLSGAFLPPQGITLPSGEGEVVNEDVIRQQLLYMAQMLEQQETVDADGVAMLPEMTQELSKALREYAEQDDIANLPEEVQLALAEKLTSDSQANIQIGVDQAKTPAAEFQSDPQLQTKAVDQQLNQVRQQDANGSVDKPAPQSVGQNNTPVTQNANPSGEVLQSSVQNAPDRLPQQESNVQRPEVSARAEINTQADAKPVQNVVAEQAVKIQQDAQQQQVIRSSESASQPVAPEQTTAAVRPLQVEDAKSVTRAAGDAQAAPNADGADVAPQILVNNKVVPEKAKVTDLVGTTPVVKAEGAPVEVDKQPVNLAAKPEVQGSLQKFESMLDASQQLMQKVISADKGSDTSMLQRIESSLSSAAQAVPQSVSQPTQVQKAVAEANNLMMPQQVKLNTPAWNNALGERAIMIAAQNTRVAEIQLDPPELGSLNVRVHVNNDQVSLSFTSPHAHVRDAVEQSLPRLREMFAEQGLALNESSVSDQQQGDGRREGLDERFAGSDGYGSGESLEEGEQPKAAARSVSLVDYYA